MPSIAEVINRAQPVRPPGHYTATVTAVNGRQVKVTLDPGGAATNAISVETAVIVGSRVLVVCAPVGNFVLGIIG
jgi:hypothetical protein